MILAYSCYSKLVYDVTTGHMTLRFELFWRETADWQEGNRQVWSGIKAQPHGAMLHTHDGTFQCP